MDFVLIEGDLAMFLPTFGAAMVVVRPGVLTSSGPAMLSGKKVCVDGDEKQVSVPGCPYVAPPHVIPGTGTLKITALASDQKAQTSKTGGKPVLLKGSLFTATFEVQSPAMQPGSPPVADTTPQYNGNGTFVTMNATCQAT